MRFLAVILFLLPVTVLAGEPPMWLPDYVQSSNNPTVTWEAFATVMQTLEQRTNFATNDHWHYHTNKLVGVRTTTNRPSVSVSGVSNLPSLFINSSGDGYYVDGSNWWVFGPVEYFNPTSLYSQAVYPIRPGVSGAYEYYGLSDSWFLLSTNSEPSSGIVYAGDNYENWATHSNIGTYAKGLTAVGGAFKQTTSMVTWAYSSTNVSGTTPKIWVTGGTTNTWQITMDDINFIRRKIEYSLTDNYWVDWRTINAGRWGCVETNLPTYSNTSAAVTNYYESRTWLTRETIPRLSLAKIFLDTGIGWVPTNTITYDCNTNVTGGTAYWQVEPQFIEDYRLWDGIWRVAGQALLATNMPNTNHNGMVYFNEFDGLGWTGWRANYTNASPFSWPTYLAIADFSTFGYTNLVFTNTIWNYPTFQYEPYDLIWKSTYGIAQIDLQDSWRLRAYSGETPFLLTDNLTNMLAFGSKVTASLYSEVNLPVDLVVSGVIVRADGEGDVETLSTSRTYSVSAGWTDLLYAFEQITAVNLASTVTPNFANAQLLAGADIYITYTNSFRLFGEYDDARKPFIELLADAQIVLNEMRQIKWPTLNKSYSTRTHARSHETNACNSWNSIIGCFDGSAGGASCSTNITESYDFTTNRVTDLEDWSRTNAFKWSWTNTLAVTQENNEAWLYVDFYRRIQNAQQDYSRYQYDYELCGIQWSEEEITSTRWEDNIYDRYTLDVYGDIEDEAGLEITFGIPSKRFRPEVKYTLLSTRAAMFDEDHYGLMWTYTSTGYHSCLEVPGWTNIYTNSDLSVPDMTFAHNVDGTYHYPWWANNRGYRVIYAATNYYDYGSNLTNITYEIGRIPSAGTWTSSPTITESESYLDEYAQSGSGSNNPSCNPHYYEYEDNKTDARDWAMKLWRKKWGYSLSDEIILLQFRGTNYWIK